MTGPTHILIGIAAVTVLGHTAGIVPDRLNFGLVLLGSVLPDIDGNGIVCRLLPGLPALSRGIERTFGHRGVFHWLFLPFLIMGITPYGGIGFFWLGFGYLSHLLADALTPGGIPARPLSRRISAKLLKTGSLAEGVLFVVLLIATVRAGFPLLDPAVQQLVKKAMGRTT